jgi:hypothetical protein
MNQRHRKYQEEKLEIRPLLAQDLLSSLFMVGFGVLRR